jgi:hypothetical protein
LKNEIDIYSFLLDECPVQVSPAVPLMMPTVESASMPVSVDYHHQVHMDESYPSIGAYPTEVHDATLYYHHHHNQHQQQQQQQHQQLISDPTTMMDSSYNLPCDYNNSTGYCPPDLHQANYPYQHYAAAGTAPSGAPDAQSSSGYYSSPVVVDHHLQQQPQQHHYASHQMTDNSSSVSSLMATPYDCYAANSHDHLELKYQAAFVDALESNHNNTSMETSSVDGSVVAASNNTSSTTTANDMDADPLQIHSNLVHQQLPTPEFQYEYETNYGNNEWTMTSGHYGAATNASYPTVPTNSEAYPTDNSLTGCTSSESDMPILSNYCFAACVFTTPPASSEPGTKVEIGTYSPTTRHFESSTIYDTSNNHYQTLNEEPLHPAL